MATEMHTLRAFVESGAAERMRFEVLGYTLTDRISDLFRLELAAKVDLPIIGGDPAVFVDHPATMVLERGGHEIRRISGITTSVTECAIEDGASGPLGDIGLGSETRGLRFVIEPATSRLQQSRTLDILLDVDLPGIVRRGFERAGLEEDTHFDVSGLEGNHLPGGYPSDEFVVQYDEDDLSFVSQRSERVGAFYYFDQGSEHSIARFGDNNAAFVACSDAESLPYRHDPSPQEFAISRLEQQVRPIPREVVVRDYNYETPGVNILATAPIFESGAGQVIEYGGGYKDPSVAQAIANIRAEEIFSTRRRFHGEANCPLLFAGSHFLVQEHPRGDIDLLITEIEHSFQIDARDGATATYKSRFVAIPYEVAFRPPRRTPAPKVSGTLNGVVESDEDDKSQPGIDELGRYRVRFLYDTTGRDDGQASHYLRMAQPLSGPGFGMHFPLIPGTEVLIQCENGDPSRPVIIGSVPNPATMSPIVRGDRDRNRLTTKAGNIQEMRDTPGGEGVTIRTPGGGDTTLQLGEVDRPETGFLLETSSNAVTEARKGIMGAASSISNSLAKWQSSRAKNNLVTLAGDPTPWNNVQKAAALIGGVGDLASGIASIGQLYNTMADDRAEVLTANRMEERNELIQRIHDRYKAVTGNKVGGVDPASRPRVLGDDGKPRPMTDIELARDTGDRELQFLAARLDRIERAAKRAERRQERRDASELAFDRLEQAGWAVSGAATIYNEGSKALANLGTFFSSAQKLDHLATTSTAFMDAESLLNGAKSLMQKSEGRARPGGLGMIDLPYSISGSKTGGSVQYGLKGTSAVLSSFGTAVLASKHNGATVTGNAYAQVVSPATVEIAGKRAVMLTTKNSLDLFSELDGKLEMGRDLEVIAGNGMSLRGEKTFSLQTKQAEVASESLEIEASQEATIKGPTGTITFTSSATSAEHGGSTMALDGSTASLEVSASTLVVSGQSVVARSGGGTVDVRGSGVAVRGPKITLG